MIQEFEIFTHRVPMITLASRSLQVLGYLGCTIPENLVFVSAEIRAENAREVDLSRSQCAARM